MIRYWIHSGIFQDFFQDCSWIFSRNSPWDSFNIIFGFPLIPSSIPPETFEKDILTTFFTNTFVNFSLNFSRASYNSSSQYSSGKTPRGTSSGNHGPNPLFFQKKIPEVISKRNPGRNFVKDAERNFWKNSERDSKRNSG